MRYIDEIIIHCSSTKEGVEFSAKDIERWHKDKGFKKIGYHYVIKLDGTIENGRPIEEMGAHCLNHNAHSIGICLIGGLDKNGKPKDTRTLQQQAALFVLLNQLAEKFQDATIHGHNEFANKACPCWDVKSEYQKYNDMIRAAYENEEGED